MKNLLLYGTRLTLAALVGFATCAPSAAQPAARPAPREIVPRGALAADEQAIVGLFERTAPSVAYITTEQLRATGFFTAEVAQGAGSGFVWDAQGHIVTNYHVLEGAERVSVRLDGGEPIPATFVGGAPEYDLAVVKLTRLPPGLKPIPLGSSRDLKIGQAAYAIGNPFGLQRTLTRGIISALERELPTLEGEREVAGVIQTDAAINPGNSGGPLLDSAGRLIGVNSAIRSASGSSAGVGFAIPVDLVNRIVPTLIAYGKVPWPGIGIDPLNPRIAARLGVTGVAVLSVQRGSPAAEAGLVGVDQRARRLGDVIVAVNGRKTESTAQLAAELDRVGVGGEAELTVQRGEAQRKVRVRVIDLRR